MATDWQTEAKERRAKIEAFLAANELSVESVFVPFSRSRSRGEKQPNLNWRITLMHKGRKVIETDYSAGCAHCPSYSQKLYGKFENRAAIERECNEGRSLSRTKPPGYMKPILPDTADVIYSLVSDGRVIDCGDFENFAAEYGYDVDSRQAEKTYQACLEIGLKLRAALGQKLFSELEEAFADW